MSEKTFSGECDECGAPTQGTNVCVPCCCNDEGRMCEKHLAARAAEFAYLRDVPRYEVFNDEEAQEERDQALIDAGRGHLVRRE